MTDSAPGAAPVIDQRTPPRGVLPRGTQTWLMVGLALGILGIIVLTGHPGPAARPATAATNTAALAPSPDRLREYQDRLRILDERARQQVMTDPRPTAMPRSAYGDAPTTAAPDPLEADRKRREYESLFSSNVVMSRRPDGQRLPMDQGPAARGPRATLAADAP